MPDSDVGRSVGSVGGLIDWGDRGRTLLLLATAAQAIEAIDRGDPERARELLVELFARAGR